MPTPVDKSLRRLVGTKNSARITRAFQDTHPLEGFVVAAADTLACLHCFHDYMPYGYMVMRVADIATIRTGVAEKHFDRIAQAENLFTGLTAAPSLDLSDIRTVSKEIADQFRYAMFHCESDEDADDHFHAGLILSVEFDIVRVACWTDEGGWEPDTCEIDLDDITRIEFDTPYIRTFAKHLADPLAPQRDRAP